jgi:hypothetical protein
VVDGWVMSMKLFSTFLAILLITSSCSNEEQVQTDVKDQNQTNTLKLFLRPTPFEKKLRGAIIIASLRGDVSVIDLFQSNDSDKNNTEPETLNAGEIVLQGSTIVSGKNSEVDLLFTNGTSAKIGPDSKLTINAIWQKSFQESEKKVSDIKEETSPTRIDLDLEIGDLIVDVKKLKKESSFIVNSPLGVAGIRGTQFKIFSESEKVELSVLDGKVSFWDQRNEKKEISNSEKLVLKINNKPTLKPLNQKEKQTIQRRIASLKESTETYELSNLLDKLGVNFRNEENIEISQKCIVHNDEIISKDTRNIRYNPFRYTRNFRAHGGKAESLHAIFNGLNWLKNNQDSDGGWGKEDVNFFGEHFEGDLLHRVAVTSMAISTFLKNCGSHECDNFGSTIANAINFLMLYPPDKGIEINESANFMSLVKPRNRITFTNAIRSEALARAYKIFKTEKLQNHSTKSFNAILESQKLNGGWSPSFSNKIKTDDNLNMTYWCVRAILVNLTSDNPSLRYPDEILEKSVKYIVNCQSQNGNFFVSPDSQDVDDSITGGVCQILQYSGKTKWEKTIKGILSMTENEPIEENWSNINIFDYMNRMGAIFKLIHEPELGKKYRRDLRSWYIKPQIVIASNQLKDGSWPVGKSFKEDTRLFRSMMAIQALQVYGSYRGGAHF